MTLKEFIDKCNSVHNNKYDYSKVNYKNLGEKIIVICPKHGEFNVLAYSHLHGSNCFKCRNEKLSSSKKMTTNLFIEKARNKFGDKFDYSEVEYIDSQTKIVIGCPIHGKFELTPSNHLRSKSGCPKCSYANLSKLYLKELNLFIIDAIRIHGDKYDYSKTNYNGSHKKVCIICSEHGEFWLTPANHLLGKGCPKCLESHGERIIRNYLDNLNIKYIFLYKIPIDVHINLSKRAYIDFYLPDFKIAIEYNGKLHYVPIEHFGGTFQFLNYLIPRDNYIKEYCKDNNIKLIEIKYDLNIFDLLQSLQLF